MNTEKEPFDPLDEPPYLVDKQTKLFEPTIEDYKRLYSDKCDEVLKLMFDIRRAERDRDELKEMFDMQTKLVVDLEIRLIKMEEQLKNEQQ